LPPFFERSNRRLLFTRHSKQQDEPRGDAVAAWELPMKHIKHNKKPKLVLGPASQPKARKSAPDWKPQPCSLTRSELRQIVGEILG